MCTHLFIFIKSAVERGLCARNYFQLKTFPRLSRALNELPRANGLCVDRKEAVTKSGTGTWDLGRGDSGTWGCGDVGTRGRGDVGTWGRGDSGTWGRGDVGTRGRGDVGTWGRGDSGTDELGDVGTHFYHLFNFSSYFTKSSSVDRNCVVPRFKFLVCMM